MPFTKIANAERKLIASEVVRDEMAMKGWCETSAPIKFLEAFGIEYEEMGSALHQRAPRNTPVATIVYVPAWVYGLWDRRDPSRPWDTMKIQFLATRDDPREQEMVCSELRLDLRAPSSTREAAYNYRYKRH